MKRSEAARYARWSAAVALVLAAGTAGVYLQREWKARVVLKNAPAAAAANILRQSDGVMFSKGEGSHKEFTVQASKSTDFKDRDLTELETVVITIFGKNGDRHDVIDTQSCQYGKTNGNVVCSGEVRMDLESAAEAERSAKPASDAVPQVLHVVTKAVTFNQKSGTAETAEPVTFAFPNGSGQGVGMEYKSEAGTVKLLREVRLKLRPPPNARVPAKAKNKRDTQSANDAAANSAPSGVTVGEEVIVTGTSLDFDRASRQMHVQGPAVAESKTTRLTAGQLTLDLDAQFRAQTLLASGNVNDEQPKVVSQGGGQMDVSADRLTAEFSPQGWVTTVAAEGNVKGVRRADLERDDASSESATIAMWPRVNEMKELNMRGNVLLKTLASSSGDARVLRTEALRMEFAESKANEAGKPLKAETLAPGRMEWTETNATSFTAMGPANTPETVKTKSSTAKSESGAAKNKSITAKNQSGSASSTNAAQSPVPAHTTLAADKLQMFFDAQGKPKQLLADGHVSTERTMAEKPTQTATAQNGAAQLLPAGGWSQMDLNGAVRLREGDRNAQADHALFRREEQTATLTGRALVRDATTETAAARIVFVQNTGDIRGEGGVRSTDLAASSTPGSSPPGADHATGSSGTGSNATAQAASQPTHITADLLVGNSQSGRALYTGHARMWQGESVLEADSIELLRETRVLNAMGNIRAVFPQAAATAPAATTTVATSAGTNAAAPALATTASTTTNASATSTAAGMTPATFSAATAATSTNAMPTAATSIPVTGTVASTSKSAGTSGPKSNVLSAAASNVPARAGQNAAKKSPLWHVTAQSLMYNDAESHAHLEHDVIAQSVDQKMHAPIVDLYFTHGTSLAAAGATSMPGHSNGPQQISRAVGTGGTTVEEGGRKAVAERGVYTASDGKFVMSGGNPTLYDGTEGNTSGRQLTFFLADDTIIVDSENGSRILTRHRVER